MWNAAEKWRYVLKKKKKEEEKRRILSVSGVAKAAFLAGQSEADDNQEPRSTMRWCCAWIPGLA